MLAPFVQIVEPCSCDQKLPLFRDVFGFLAAVCQIGMQHHRDLEIRRVVARVAQGLSQAIRPDAGGNQSLSRDIAAVFGGRFRAAADHDRRGS